MSNPQTTPITSTDNSVSSTTDAFNNSMEEFTTVEKNTLKTEPGSSVHETELTESDVLSGRGNGVAGHEGNQFYTRLIKENQQEYQRILDGKKKKQIALSIIDIIKGQEPAGRFLKSEKGQAFMWKVQDDSFAMKKVTQALREKPKLKKKAKNGEEDYSFLFRHTGTSSTSGANPSMKKTILGTRKRDESFDQSQQHHLDGPTKKTIVGSSRRIMAKWMQSMSKLNLINSSFKEIPISDQVVPPAKDDVLVAMEELSGDNFDSSYNMVQDIGNRLDVLLTQAMPSSKKGLTNDGLNNFDLGEDLTEEFISLMETSVRSLQSPSQKTLQSALSASSYQGLAKEMNQAVKDEIHHLREEFGQEKQLSNCISSKSLLSGSLNVPGIMNDGEDDNEANEKLRDVLMQLAAADSVQSSMGNLDISS